MDEAKFKLQGDRLRELIDDNKDTVTDVAEALFMTRQNVYNYINGKSLISESDALILAERWNVLPDYLLGKINYATEEELYVIAPERDLKEYKSIISFLERFEIKLIPSVFWVCDEAGFRKGFWKLKGHLTEEALNRANDTDFFVTEIIPTTEHWKTRYFELKDTSILKEKNLFDSVATLTHKTNAVKDGRNLFSESIADFFDDFTSRVEIRYKVVYKGEEIGVSTIERIQSLISFIDKMLSIIIEDSINNSLVDIHYCDDSLPDDLKHGNEEESLDDFFSNLSSDEAEIIIRKLYTLNQD